MKKFINHTINLIIAVAILWGSLWVQEHIHIAKVNLVPHYKTYTVKNALYTNPELITPDQNIWWYRVTDIPAGSTVTVIFNDMGTPDNIYDDMIMGLIAQQ